MNRVVLIQALTSPSFANLFGPGNCASNASLEWEGDEIIRACVDRWLKKLAITTPGLKGFLRNFLNSNLYFSRRALELELDSCIRSTLSETQVQKPESRIRATANAFEALVGAVERDAGDKACEAFVTRFVLPNDLLMQNIVLLASTHLENVRSGFDGIAKGRAELSVTERFRRTQVAVLLGGNIVGEMSSTGEVTDTARDVIFRSLTRHPWLLWGAEGNMSVYLPSASCSAYGDPIPDQRFYRSGRSTIPAKWLENNGFPTTNAPVHQPPPPVRPRFREEDVWPDCDLPPILPGSTAERGPYIDKLRMRLGADPLEVRAQGARKGQCTHYAFYVGGEHRHTVEGKNLNDAANQIIRLMAT